MAAAVVMMLGGAVVNGFTFGGRRGVATKSSLGSALITLLKNIRNAITRL